MTQRKQPHSHEWWMSYIDEWHTTDLSMKRFCEIKNISYQTFQWHQRVESQKNKPVEVLDVVPVKITEVSDPGSLNMKINGTLVESDLNTIRLLLGVSV